MILQHSMDQNHVFAGKFFKLPYLFYCNFSGMDKSLQGKLVDIRAGLTTAIGATFTLLREAGIKRRKERFDLFENIDCHGGIALPVFTIEQSGIAFELLTINGCSARSITVSINVVMICSACNRLTVRWVMKFV